MGRWLRRAWAVGVLALVACARPAPAPPPPAPPPPGSCVPRPLKDLAASIPGCAGIPAGLLDAARLKDAPLGSRVSVRGVLVLGGAECTMKACTHLRPDGRPEPAPCCNSCRALWRLAGWSSASATPTALPATEILLRRAGDKRPLVAGGKDCVMSAMAVSPREEIIASGRLEPGGAASDLASPGLDVLLIDDAALCATGGWIPQGAAADGGLPGCR